MRACLLFNDMLAMKRIVVLSGAGISADSGLQTFRDADGLWAGYRIEDVCTPEAFARNPQQVIDFYNMRRRQAMAAQPNAAHYSLQQLESKYDVEIITQNVDLLHERAGSRKILHLHGRLDQLRSSVDEEHIEPIEGDQSIRQLDMRLNLMRPNIVWFGEPVPEFMRATRLMDLAEIVIVVGTSLKVYPAASLLEYSRPRTEIYLVDPNPPEAPPGLLTDVIAKRACEGVPELVEMLLARV